MSDTIKEVLKNELAAMGDRTEKITFTCTAETREYLVKWANDEGRSISNLIERLALKAIAEREATIKTNGDRE